jgi:hypothetical protein
MLENCTLIHKDTCFFKLIYEVIIHCNLKKIEIVDTMPDDLSTICIKNKNKMVWITSWLELENDKLSYDLELLNPDIEDYYFVESSGSASIDELVVIIKDFLDY